MSIPVLITIHAITPTPSLPSLLLKHTKAGTLGFLTGKYKKSDPSSIFAASRILFKNLDTSCPGLHWNSLLFRQLLTAFANAELIRHPDGNYSFIVELPLIELPAQLDRLKLVTLTDLQSSHPNLYEEYENLCKDVAETKKYYEITERSKNHFAIFDCSISPGWDNYYDALYMGWLKNKGEKWVTYKIPKMEFPNEEELRKIKGIVISGSGWHVYDSSNEAITVFLKRLKELIENFPWIKILGVCFGCQALAAALGGVVERMQLENKEMLLMREKLDLANGFSDQMKKVLKVKAPEFCNEDLTELYIVECHSDNVIVLPEGAILYATSERTPVEIYGIGDTILAFQGHPEFNGELIMEKILPGWKEGIVDYEQVYEEARKSLMEGEVHQKLFGIMCESFLKEEY